MAVGLTIDSQSLDIPGAWEHDLSLGRLRSVIKSRGSSRLLPNLPGRRPYPILPDEVVVDLVLEVYGDKDSTGASHVSIYAGLEDNLTYLTDFVLDGWDGATTTRPAVLEMPGGRTFSADVQILNWQVLRHEPTIAYVSYDLHVPAGVWTETTL